MDESEDDFREVVIVVFQNLQKSQVNIVRFHFRRDHDIFDFCNSPGF